MPTSSHVEGQGACASLPENHCRKGNSSSSRGQISVVGMGPGSLECLSPEGRKEIEGAQTVIGYQLYIKLLEPLLKDKRAISYKMREEVARGEEAINLSLRGEKVALISSGDPGVYGMAGLLLELAKKSGLAIAIKIIPGITALHAAASILGAPLMHDHAVISLSDLLTPWEEIEKRIHLASQGDFVIAFYNPKSSERQEQIVRARSILLLNREEKTPVGIVRNAKRENEELVITNLKEMLQHRMDMRTIVIVGNSCSYVHNGRMITPRGYFPRSCDEGRS